MPPLVFRRSIRCAVLCLCLGPARSQEEETRPEPLADATEPRPVESVLEAQVELHRRGFSCGSIDGVAGPQTAAALRAFQRAASLEPTGRLDQQTREALALSAPALTGHVLSTFDIGRLQPLSATWLGKSQQSGLEYASVLERIAELYRASPNFLKRLNPEIDWEGILPGAVITVPAVQRASIEGHPAEVVIRLEARELQVLDDAGRVIAHFPVSIARMAEKRPVGELRVVVVIPDPNYTFDPAVFPESAEGRELGRKLILPPGPNNPVGLAWIGLDRPGYGIHGTPDPERVGRTESHGCFRLANWDALTLLRLAFPGMIVRVEP